MADLDELVIKVDTDAKEADSGLDSLASTLESIKEKCKGGAGLASVAKRLSGINSALNTFKAENASKLNAVATALGGLSSLNGVKLSSTIGTQIGEICKSVSGVDDTAAYKIGEIGNAVRGLSGLDNVTISSSIGNQLGSIVDATVALPPDAKDKLQSLSEGLAPFATLGKAQLTTFINQLGKLPDVVEKLDKADMSKFASQMQDVASCMRPLADEMQRVSNGFSAFPERIQRIITENERLSASNARTGRSFGLLKAGASIAVFRKLGHALADCFSESNKYVEDLNLFTVAMGDAADEAFEYANRVREAIGIDPAEWMRNQGVFKQITSGFGVVEDKANLMSKNLTQIGYDISSFYNIGIEEAMQKVQSGIAGELEPLRRLGYALDQATLQQIAYDHGITQSFNTMNQAQKSQLRYIAIMQQSRNVMGDMARTALTPANALRILKQEVTQLARAVGNILVPGLIKIIPVVQAVVQVLAEAAQFIAGLLGFKLPTIDYSGLGAGIGEAAGGAADLEDSLGGAGAAAKELKKTVMGFDELNLLNAPPETGGGGGGGAWRRSG